MAGGVSSAVVLGGSISGLMVAQALSKHFDNVLIIERDQVGEDAEVRKGVPQGAHGHGLLAGGYQIMDSFFPGLMKELEASGAPHGDMLQDFLWFQYGHWKLRFESGLRGMVASRPHLEQAIRRKNRAVPTIKFVQAEAAGLKLDSTKLHVTGVLVRTKGAERPVPLHADLVVDASGRGSQSAKWLEDAGFDRPKEISVRVDVGYATRLFERKPGDLHNAYGAIISGTPPSNKRYAGVFAIEGDRWLVTLTGNVGDIPPTDEEGWVEFAASLPVPEVHTLVTSAKPLSQIVGYKFPANRRRLYERLKRFPSGYLIVGDAMCSFNPIYGQGMTVAANQAKALDDCLAEARHDLWPRFYARTRKVVDGAWEIATGEDLRFPEVEGKRPLGFNLVNRYLDRVHVSAARDPVVCRKFFDVLNLLEPPSSLLSPRLVLKVASGL